VEGLGFTLLRGERLGILGPNGCGKTTLLKLLTRQLDPLAGLIAWGSNVSLGVFSQDSADLLPGNTVLSELRRAEPTISDGEARGYLARFGFSGGDVMKDSGSLSGGERSRLSLARIFRKRPNVLVLDEPTNHLDIYAREALEQFLQDYQGTVIMVTHDRALLERICDRLVIFEPLAAESSGQASYSAKFFRGSYRDYLRYGWGDAADETGALPSESTRAATSGLPKKTDSLPDPGSLAELARQSRTSPAGYCSKQLDRLRRRMDELERMIEALEGQIRELSGQQRERDQAGDYGAITRLQMEIDTLASARDRTFDELAEVEAQSADWEMLRLELAQSAP
jgi:ATP-binding cassette subfamily F protein 3